MRALMYRLWPVLLAVILSGCAGEAGDERPLLRWGADREGGGPFIYPPEEDPGGIVGFEVDLAAALAGEIDRAPRFTQGQWDQLLAMLSRADCDVVLNGYEYTPARAERYLASIPYYIYELGLAVRRDDETLRGWDDLNRPRPDGGRRTIAVLTESAADHYATERFGGACDIRRFDGSTEALHLLQNGQIDATIQDLPILDFYITRERQYPLLETVGPEVAPGYYVVYARPEDRELIEQVNQAIRRLYDSGRLEEIYERYGIWNETQRTLPEVWETWDSSLRSSATGTREKLARWIVPLLKASLVTIALASLSMPLAIAIGLFVAIVRAWDSPALGGSPESASLPLRPVRWLCTLYVEVVRGTPLAFQLFVIFFVLPEAGIHISAFWAGVVGLAINYSAYEAEIFRLGIQAIPRGQMEAALSLGMSRPMAVYAVILPQVVRVVLPATANDFIALFKDTAVCSVIAVEELSKQYSIGAKSTGLFIELALMASVLYLAMSYPLSLLSGWLERRLAGGK
ncbi:MAG: ABC transporter substrate-binding protein/permease [Planctomycetales bacterium]